MSDSADQHRPIKSFVIRAGRMTRGQRRGFEWGWERFGLTHEQGVLEPKALLRGNGSLILEIGFGMGGSLVEMAAAAPDDHYIGIDVHKPGVGALLASMDQAGVENISVYCHDAVEILKDCIPDQSLARVQIFFPDPWHKKRHHKRRLIQRPFLEALRPKIAPGGVLHLATDWEDYARQMLVLLDKTEGFSNCQGAGMFAPRPDYRPLTKFEKRGERLGHGVWDLLYRRTT